MHPKCKILFILLDFEFFEAGHISATASKTLLGSRTLWAPRRHWRFLSIIPTSHLSHPVADVTGKFPSRIETLQHPSPSPGLADAEQTAFGDVNAVSVEMSPRFCLPQASRWSHACVVAPGKEPYLCSFGDLTRSTFQGSLGKEINSDDPLFQNAGADGSLKLQLKSDHANGGTFPILFPSMPCWAREKEIHGQGSPF